MSGYAVQDERDSVPEGVVGEVRTEVDRDERGDALPDVWPEVVRDEGTFAARDARQDEGVEAARDETSDAVRAEGQRAAWDGVHDEVQLALRWPARVVA